jgi:nitrous oxide reductase accessory protein NosL
MKRNLLLSVAFVALLAGCKDDETAANEKLTEAVAQIAAAESAATQT